MSSSPIERAETAVFFRMKPGRVALAAALAILSSSCGGHTRRIRIPEAAMQDPKDGPKELRRRGVEPYVVKMSDGQRTWQFEIPVADGTSTFRSEVPLDLKEADHELAATAPTEADREIIEAKKKRGEKTPDAKATAAGGDRSYLGTLARVRALYKRRQYELALMDLVALDRAYPDDEKILEMKGTLYLKLNRPSEAREAWERVLNLRPENTTVARALEELADVSDGAP